MLNVSLTGDKALIQRFKLMGPNVQKALLRKVTILTLALERLVKEKLSGGVLNVRTGALRSGIHHDIESTPTKVTGSVASSRDVPYAAIHEFGGSINHPGGTAYYIDGKSGIAQFVSNTSAIADLLPRTKPHVINLPERSFLRSSLRDMSERIKTELGEAVKEGMREASKP
jgi:phage gpG-like protein